MRDPHDEPDLDLGSEDDAALMRQLFPLDDASGPAPRRSAADLDAIVTAALAAHTAAPTPQTPATPPQAPNAPIPPALLLAGAALILGALAALWLTQSPPTPDPATAPASDSASASDSDSASDSAGASASASDSAGASDSASDSAGASDSASDSAGASDSDSDSASAPAPAPASDPRDLLREANALRGSGAFSAAERLYLRVVREHPRSPSAYVAKVAAASLRLDRLGNPAGAISLFRSALRDNPSGSLAPEIRRGLALATRRAGQRDAEQRALRDYLAHHAGTPFAASASARLGELEAAARTPE